MNGNKEFLSSCVFAALLGAACTISMLHLRPALSTLETPAAKDLIQGKWPKQFENAFRESLPVSLASRNLWGRLEYALFHEGRKGVIVGAQGWLYTNEEFSCPAHYKQNLIENQAFIDSVKKTLAQKNTRLAIVLVPAKTRVLPEHMGENSLPSCRKNLYTDIRSSLVSNNIPVTDLLPVMLSSVARESLYLKTDTHWTPDGAKLAARTTAQLVQASFKDIELPENSFTSQAGGTKPFAGDLTGYLPGVGLPPDHFTSYISGTAVASTQIEQGLFGDAAPAVTLVGTSYSANTNWNFEGFLKEYLETDVLNMADQGLGPLVVMDKYLENDAWKNSPPRLVIWEMPERYLLMPHGVSAP